MSNPIRTKHLVLAGFLFTSFLAANVNAAQNGDFSFSFGAEYTSGDYGSSQNTDIWYFPFTFKYETDRFSASITAPLIMVDGPGNIVPGGDARGLPINRAPRARDTEIGVGDIQLRGSANLMPETKDGPRVDITGKVKFGTADFDDGLGTGEDDFSVQFDLERNFGSAGIFGSIGYRMLGDPPGTNYRDVPYGTIGAVFRMSDTTSIGASFEAQDNVLHGTSGQRDVTLFLSSKADERTRVTGYVLRGLSDYSPDWGVGVAVRLYQ